MDVTILWFVNHNICNNKNEFRKKGIPPIEASHLIVESSIVVHLEHALAKRQLLAEPEQQYIVVLEEHHFRGRQILREHGRRGNTRQR